MTLNLVLSSGPGLENTQPPQAHPTNSAKMLALTPGKWSARVLSWQEGKVLRFSAINSWNAPDRWVCYFYFGVFLPDQPLMLHGVGQSAEQPTAEAAFKSFPPNAMITIKPGSRGPTYPVPVIFMVPTDLYYEAGELHIELEWHGFA